MKKLAILLLMGLILQNLTAQTKFEGEHWMLLGITLFNPFQNHYEKIFETQEGDRISSITLREMASVNLGFGIRKINEKLWHQEYALIAAENERNNLTVKNQIGLYDLHASIGVGVRL